ncbi:MAG: hypothetical protein AAFP26_13580, partial [Planctomycetota bacterium]
MLIPPAGWFVQTFTGGSQSPENPGGIRQQIIDTGGQWLIDTFNTIVANGGRLIMTNTLAGGQVGVRVPITQYTALPAYLRDFWNEKIPEWKAANPGVVLMTYIGSTVRLGEGPDSLSGGVSGAPATHEWGWERDEIGVANVNGLARMGFDLIGVDAARDEQFRHLFRDADRLASRVGCRLVMEATVWNDDP